MTLPTLGAPGAEIFVVADAPSRDTFASGLPMSQRQLDWLIRMFREYDLEPREDFFIQGLCSPIPQRDLKSASRKWDHVEQHVEEVRAAITTARPMVVVTFGELATRAVIGRAVKITKVRGVPVVRENNPPVLPMLSPGFVERIPDHLPTFIADVATLARLKNGGWDVAAMSDVAAEYEWRTDISDFLGPNKPSVIAIDTEGTGLRWWDPSVHLLTVQFCDRPGRAFAVPVDEEYWGQFAPGQRDTLVGQLRELLEDPDVRKIGQNIKFDHMMLRKLDIEVQGWLHDTMVMAFACDENMLSLGLDDLVRVHVPAMAGYADEFNRTYDKARMWEVPHDDMLMYACADPDATFRLARVLQGNLARDPRQQRVYRRLQMPAIMCFANVIEPYGLLVDQDRLRSFGEEVEGWLVEENRALMRMVPARVRRRHLNEGKDITFSRSVFVVDTLFGPEGFGIKPCVFTASTEDLPLAQQVPSTSAKQHFPYFVNDPRIITGTDTTVGTFVTRLIEYQKTRKLFNTYIGKENDPDKGNAPSGFWKYLSPSSRIHPSYGLTFVNTGRTNSRDPNGQNFPARGRWAKRYREMFRPTPGYKFVAADLSQIELRVVAWMAAEPTMLAVFRAGGDIHSSTAAAVMGITDEVFAALPKDVRTQKRYEAKAVNFGFIYGMRWRKFMQYAKVDYGLDFTEAEAKAIYDAFFDKYPGLLRWHDTMKTFVRRHGYVRGLCGAMRHLPSIYSVDEQIRAAAERNAVNSPIQRLGSDIGVMALVMFTHRADPERMRILGFIHDQLFIEAREDCVDEAVGALKWTMENPPLRSWFDTECPVPIIADVEVGDDGGNMEERPDAVAIRPDWWVDDDALVAAQFLAVRRGSGEGLATGCN